MGFGSGSQKSLKKQDFEKVSAPESYFSNTPFLQNIKQQIMARFFQTLLGRFRFSDMLSQSIDLNPEIYNCSEIPGQFDGFI